MSRYFLSILACVMSGCCTDWWVGTPELRDHRYKPNLEPWAGHQVRAQRRTQYCNYLIGPRTYQSYWVYEGSRVPLKENPTSGEKWLYEKGRSNHDYVRLTNRKINKSLFGQENGAGRSESARAFMANHDVAVVCVKPLVFVTFPSESPEGWKRAQNSFYYSDIRGATEFISPCNITVWVPPTENTLLPHQGIEIDPIDSFQFDTEWGALLIHREADRIIVTTEGLE